MGNVSVFKLDLKRLVFRTWNSAGMLLFLLNALWTPRASADWPAILGPTRDGHSDTQTPLYDAPDCVMKTRWKLPAGEGFAGAAIQGDFAILYDRIGGSDRVRKVDFRTGAVQWEQAFAASYQGRVNPDSGPRSVPAIANGRVVVYSASGEVACFELSQGKPLWKRSIRKEMNADDGYFGAGASPLIVKDSVLINVGGKKGGIALLRLDDGTTIWTATSDDSCYASPISILSGGSEQLVVPMRLATYGISPRDGKVLWKFPFGQRGPTVNAATPIAIGPNEFLQTASYGIGTVVFQVDGLTVKTENRDEILASQYSTPVLCNGALFASDGREDFNTGTFKCLNRDATKVLWEKKDMPIAHPIVIQNQILVFGVDGTLVCIAPSTEKWDPRWEHSLPQGVYRAMPAFSENCLLVKSESSWIALEFQKP